MRKLLFLVLICSIQVSMAAVPPAADSHSTTVKSTANLPPSLAEILKLKIKDAEKLTGKKFTLKDKIAFKILQHKIRKTAVPEEEDWAKQGKTAMILGIIALGVLFIPYVGLASIPLAILAIVKGNKVKKADPGNKKANTAVVLGWVALGLFALFLIIAAVYVAAFFGGFN